MSGIVETAIALEKRLAAMLPALDTQFESVDYIPVSDRPYQIASILWATPVNAEMSARYQEQGAFHVALRYPRKAGGGAARERAQALREWFPRKLNLVEKSISVLIIRTPAIYPAIYDEDRFVIPVSIPFLVNN